MKRLLYIGNNLKSKHTNITSIEILGDLLEQEGFSVFYASSKRNKILRLLDMLSSCFKLRNKVDIVLIDTYSTSNFYYAFLVSQLCRVLGVSYVPILHGGNLANRLKKSLRLSKMLFGNARHLVSPSLYLKKVFEQNGYKDVRFIPNSIQLSDYTFNKRKIDTIKLLWVRSFSEIYNPKLAIEILKSLQDDGYETSLCMVGPDSDGSLKTIKALASELNLQVTFTGKLSKKDWHDLSTDYTVFVNTTNFDNMPVSVIEAMALGLPVVSTNVGGLPYLIENKIEGLLVIPNNPKAFAEAILKLKNNPQLTEEMTVNARRKVEDYDWQKVKILWKQLLS